MATNGMVLGLALVDEAVAVDVVAALAAGSSPGSASSSSLSEPLDTSTGSPVVVLGCGGADVGVVTAGGGGIATAGETVLFHTL